MVEPIIAAMTDGTDNLKFTNLFLIKRKVASEVPQVVFKWALNPIVLNPDGQKRNTWTQSDSSSVPFFRRWPLYEIFSPSKKKKCLVLSFLDKMLS